MRRLIMVTALAMLPRLAHAWTLETVNPYTGTRYCIDLPYELGAHTMRTPDDVFVSDRQANKKATIISYPNYVEITFGDGVSSGKDIVFNNHNACENAAAYANQH